MIIRYRFSSPEGDISLTPEDLARPFLIAPSQKHPFLTLGDYFDSIRDFLLKEGGLLLGRALNRRLDRGGEPGEIQSILIRSEKHGALYHMASVEVSLNGARARFAVSTAISEKGKDLLGREYATISSLNRNLDLPYLPRVYYTGDVERRGGHGQKEVLAMLLSEWFEDFHEWHFTKGNGRDAPRLRIWDLGRGYRYATQGEAFLILREASRILTLYYDFRDFSQIYPWHHGAGDFVIKIRDGRVDVRLTTVRGYGSMMERLSEDRADPVTALVYFFLNLSVRMRLDRVDGVGRGAWVGDFSVEAAVRGFFEAIQVMEKGGKVEPGMASGLLSVFKSFSVHELERLMQPLLGLYEEDDAGDFPMILANIAEHVRLLGRVLGNLRL